MVCGSGVVWCVGVVWCDEWVLCGVMSGGGVVWCGVVGSRRVWWSVVGAVN